MTTKSDPLSEPAEARPLLSLHPLTSAGASQIEHWFDHPEVQHRLGGRFWIHRELRLISERPGSTFRGKTVLRSHGWIALDQTQVPVAFIGGYVYDPAQWRRGYGRTAIEAALDHTDVTDVEMFFCGIDADNHPSQRCAIAAGFHLVDPKPDHEGMLHFRRERRSDSRKQPTQNTSIHNS